MCVSCLRCLSERTGLLAMPQRWNKDSVLAKSFLEALLGPPRSQRGLPAKDKPEWTCGKCSTQNFQTRQQCRSCKAKKGAKPSASGTPSSARATQSAQPPRPKAEAAKEEAKADKDERRPAPEAVQAEANDRAAALEQSAVKLRAAGLEARAEELEAEAVRERKRAESAELSPGKRLDSLKRWLERAEGRLRRATEEEEDAEGALKDARKAREKLQKELDEGKLKLQELRSELSDEKDDDGDAVLSDGLGPQAATAAETELQLLRVQLELARTELETLRSAEGPATQQALAAQLQQLQAQLLQTQRAAAQAGEDAKSAKATQAEQAEELEDFRKEKARRWQKSAELQPLSVEALQEQLDANVTEYVAVAGRGEWLAALRLSERSQLLTEALQDAHERSVGLNG